MKNFLIGYGIFAGVSILWLMWMVHNAPSGVLDDNGNMKFIDKHGKIK